LELKSYCFLRAKSARTALNSERLEAFLSGPVIVLAFEDKDARTAALIRAALEVSGKPIGAYDLLVAGQAVARELILVTANVSKFSRVKGLSWQDWAKSYISGSTRSQDSSAFNPNYGSLRTSGEAVKTERNHSHEESETCNFNRIVRHGVCRLLCCSKPNGWRT
jgi:predicted nucleic acid-binding protein